MDKVFTTVPLLNVDTVSWFFNLSPLTVIAEGSLWQDSVKDSSSRTNTIES